MLKGKKGLAVAAMLGLMLMAGCGDKGDATTAADTTAATTAAATEEAKTEAKSEEKTTEKKTEEKTTEKKTEATTEKKTEATTEKKTEATTEKKTEATTEKKKEEKTTEKKTEATTEKKTEATTEKKTEASTEDAPAGTLVDLYIGDVWAKNDMASRLGYYVLKDKDNVIYIDAVTGETKNYIISQDGEEVVFLNNERNEYISGSRYADEEHKIYLSDASVIKLYEEQTADTFTIFSANDFLEKAKAYVKDLTGADPGESYVALDDIGFALVTVNGSDGKLYFFNVNTDNGAGYVDVNNGESNTEVDFSK